jgi:iron complex transport system substrate-binding protein
VRVASLLASGTELVCALGAGDWLVARSHECDHPPWVKRLPVASRPTFDISGTSGEIDARVRRKLAAGEPLYQVDEALLADLAPDVIITQSHCEVCAVTPGDLGRTLCRQQVVALHTGTLDGVLSGFAAVARVLGLEARAGELVAGIRARLRATGARVATLGPAAARPAVACLEWIDPIFTMANWGPELVELAGGRDVLGGLPGEHSAASPWERVRAADPDVVVVAPCGFDLARACHDMPALAAQPGFAALGAVRRGQVFVADGNLYFNRSSPSLFDSVDLLAEILHPQAFPARFGHAWRRWPC